MPITKRGLLLLFCLLHASKCGRWVGALFMLYRYFTSILCDAINCDKRGFLFKPIGLCTTLSANINKMRTLDVSRKKRYKSIKIPPLFLNFRKTFPIHYFLLSIAWWPIILSIFVVANTSRPDLSRKLWEAAKPNFTGSWRFPPFFFYISREAFDVHLYITY